MGNYVVLATLPRYQNLLNGLVDRGHNVVALGVPRGEHHQVEVPSDHGRRFSVELVRFVSRATGRTDVAPQLRNLILARLFGSVLSHGLRKVRLDAVDAIIVMSTVGLEAMRFSLEHLDAPIYVDQREYDIGRRAEILARERQALDLPEVVHPLSRLLDRSRAEHRLAHTVVCSSSQALSSLLPVYQPKSEVVPLGARLPAIGEIVPTAPPQRLSLVYTGSLDPEKGLRRLMRLAGSLCRHERLTVIGAAPAYALKLLASTPTEGEVIFTGRLPWEQMVSHYRRSTAMVFPTFGDGWGMAASEALSLGLPVIASPEAGISTILDNSPSGLVSDFACVDGLLERFRAVDSQVGLRGRPLSEWFTQKYSWDAYAEKYERLLLGAERESR